MAVSLPGTLGQAMAAGTVHTPNAWVHIADDNTITILSAHSEMGQGVYTSMPMLVAEELNVDMSQIKVTDAPPGAAYVNALLGAQITGGSTSVRDGWEKLRIAGAQVREMLLTAAAARWGVDKDALKADKGVVTGPKGLKATYGELAEAAARMPVPEAPKLKDPSLEERIADLEAYVGNGARANVANTNLATKIGGAGPGHNGFQMICTALVLFMTLPGLALFYGGLVRRKNVPTITYDQR